MSIAERLIELKLIKHNLKTIINGLGGRCGENFTLYHTDLEKLITERDTGNEYFTNFNISDNITKIGDYAFPNAKFSSINVPSSVKSIGERAFFNNRSLTSVTISEGVKQIGSEAFNSCSNLEQINLPQSLEYIGWGHLIIVVNSQE